jgi:hypothetical protein
LQGPHGIGVELHRSTGPAIAPEEAWRRASAGGEELEWHGLQVRVPPATEMLWHGLTHAVQAGPGGFGLRYFLDGATILASASPVDWARLEPRLAAGVEADQGLAGAWLTAAADLAGTAPPTPASAPRLEFDLERSVAWRLKVLGGQGSRRFGERLLDEGTRIELGVGAAPVVPGTGPLRQARRWVAGRVARLAYRGWRAAARTSARGRGRVAWA